MEQNRTTSSFRSAFLNRNSRSISKCKKGKRAKHIGRTEYGPVLLEFGFISQKEMDAADTLRAFQSIENEAVSQTIPFIPSKPEILAETVRRFVEFVGATNDTTPVEFVIPQVAEQMKIKERTLNFIIEVLLPLQVVVPGASGGHLWRGTEAIWSSLSDHARRPYNLEILQGDSVTLQLQRICVYYFDLLYTHKEPISVAFASQQISFRITNEDTSMDCRRLSQIIRCISAVLTGIGLIKDIRTRPCIQYTLNKSSNHHHHQQQQQTASEEYSETRPEFVNNNNNNIQQSESPLSSCYKSSTGSNKHNSVEFWSQSQVASQVELGNSTEFRSPAQNAFLTSCCTRVQRQDSAKTNQFVPMQAAIMEFIGNEVNSVQIVNVLNNETSVERRQNSAPSTAEPLIALAVPEWMIQNQRLQNERIQNERQCNFVLQRLAPMMMQSAQTVNLNLLHHGTAWSAQQDRLLSSHTGFLSNENPFYAMQNLAQSPPVGFNQVFDCPSQLETVAKFLKDSFEAQSNDFLMLSDRDRVQQYNSSRLKQF
eukprot:g62.t1